MAQFGQHFGREGLIATSFVWRRRRRTWSTSERAMAELVTVVQSIWPAARASSDFGIRLGDVAAFVDDDLLDDARRRR